MRKNQDHPRPVPRRLLALALAAVLTVTAVPSPAPAQVAVYDIAVHVENILQTLSQAFAILQRIEEIRHLLAQVEWMAEQLEGLEDPRSREVATLLFRLQVLLQRGEALAYTLEDLASRYEELYRGWEARDEPAEEVRHQTEVALDTIQAVLLSTQALSRNDIPAQRAIGRMKDQLAAAETNAELIQASGLMTAWTGEEVSKLLQQTAALTNLKAVYYAHQINSRAQAEATLEEWLAEGYDPDLRYDASDAPSLVPPDYPGAGFLRGGQP